VGRPPGARDRRRRLTVRACEESAQLTRKAIAKTGATLPLPYMLKIMNSPPYRAGRVGGQRGRTPEGTTRRHALANGGEVRGPSASASAANRRHEPRRNARLSLFTRTFAAGGAAHRGCDLGRILGARSALKQGIAIPASSGNRRLLAPLRASWCRPVRVLKPGSAVASPCYSAGTCAGHAVRGLPRLNGTARQPGSTGRTD
jgi:hypothetical protein